MVEGEALQLNLALGVMLGIFSNCFFIQGIATGVYSKSGYYVLSGLALLSIPLLISLYIVWFTVRDCATEQYQMMSLTDLPNKLIVWGYLRSAWSHIQFLFGLQFGFALIFIVTSNYFVLSNTLYYTFPYQRNPNTQNFEQSFWITLGLFIVGYIGVCLFTSASGVWLALLIRRLNSAFMATIVLNSLCLAIWFVFVQHELDIFLNVPTDVMISIRSVILSIIPFMLWLIILRLAYISARRPLSS